MGDSTREPLPFTDTIRTCSFPRLDDGPCFWPGLLRSWPRRLIEFESTFGALLDSIDSENDKKVRRSMRAGLTELEWEYGDVSFQLNQCVQLGGVIGEVVPLEEGIQSRGGSSGHRRTGFPIASLEWHGARIGQAE